MKSLPVNFLFFIAFSIFLSFQSTTSHGTPVPPHPWTVQLEKAFPYTFNGLVDMRFSLPKESSDDINEEYTQEDEDKDDEGELIYVVERNGKIWVFPKDTKDEDMRDKKKLFLDLSDRLTLEGEMGLLSMAFHPDFPENPHFYVSYVYREEKNKNATVLHTEEADVETGAVEEEDDEEEEDVDQEILKNLKKGKKIVHCISKFKVKKRSKADKTSEKVLMSIYKPSVLHQGGSLFFGKNDGYLYISVGDSKRPKQAQNTHSYLGKILRIDVDLKEEDQRTMLTEGEYLKEEDYYSEESLNDKYYGIPSDNPFSSDGGYPEIYALGFRNPWRCSVSESKDVNGEEEGELEHRHQQGHGKGKKKEEQIWCGDVGDKSWEEINLVQKGKNYGWPIMEGFWCWVDIHCNTQNNYELPFYAYPHPDVIDPTTVELSEGEKYLDNSNLKRWPFPPLKYQFPFNGSAVVGGYLYEGEKVSWLKGGFVFGDYVDKKIGAFFFEEGKITQVREILPPGILETGVQAFGVDSCNELYVLTGGRNRPIFKLKEVTFLSK